MNYFNMQGPLINLDHVRKITEIVDIAHPSDSRITAGFTLEYSDGTVEKFAGSGDTMTSLYERLRTRAQKF